MPKRFPNSSPIRFIYLFWSFACLVIVTFYSGYFYSIMTFPIDNSAIDSVEMLAHEQAMGRIQVTEIKDSSYYNTFKV